MKIINSRYGKLFAFNGSDLIGKSLATYGEWAQREIWFLEKLMHPGNVVLDVGAYVGTHTLAFSEFVGPFGAIHSFEPQAAAFSALEKSIAENKLKNIHLHQIALGEHNTQAATQSAFTAPHNAGSFSLLNAEDAGAGGPSIAIKTLDSLDLGACDFIKVDVEGMEAPVLRGGKKTISKFRPVIVCECNFLETSAPVLQWAKTNGYDVYGTLFSAFNPHNYFETSKNIYGSAGEALLALIPTEKFNYYSVHLKNVGAAEIRTIDQLSFLLLRKPQYVAEAKAQIKELPHTLADESTKHMPPNYPTKPEDTHKEIKYPRKIRIIVPFYKNPQLVRPLFNSLVDCADELLGVHAQISFYNDSPDDPALNNELEKCIRDRRSLKLSIEINPKNLGFVGTVNRALESAIEAREDIILLNSDTCVFPGLFHEVLQVAYSDPMIGFVSPRSNCATICTLPHDSEFGNLSPEKGFMRYKMVSRHLPKVSYVPTAVGFCLLIKWNILAEFGGLDPIYGRGYNEENDLVMRANRFGYRAALANHAFVWHQGEQSFSSLNIARPERENENAKILNSRYPEYSILIESYFRSTEYRAEKLLGALCTDTHGRLRIAFDFSHFGAYYNGTFEAGKQLLFSAARCWPKEIEIIVFMSWDSWEFHQLSLCLRANWVDTHAPNAEVAAIVRMGQPYDADSIRRMLVRSPVVCAFMLDTISLDCGYLKVEFDEVLWRFALRWFDVIFTNSGFTADQFRRRYLVGEKTLIYPSLHSATPHEYAEHIQHEVPSITVREKNEIGKVMVIGNKFAHKALASTVIALASALPNLHITALGCTELDLPNATCIQSGTLTEQELEQLYNQVDAVVFPSHYEGFGFPILHALAREKPIYLRKLPAFEEIHSRIVIGQKNIRWFETTKSLIEELAHGASWWEGPKAEGEQHGWDRSAREVLSVVQGKIHDVSQQHVADRLQWFELAFQTPPNIDPRYRSKAELATRFITVRFSQLVNVALSNRLIYATARFAWGALKKLRA